MHSKRLIAFDMDGTLTESGCSMDHEMGELLSALLGSGRMVAIISGGSFESLNRQVLARWDYPRKFLKNFFLFPLCGATLW